MANIIIINQHVYRYIDSASNIYLWLCTYIHKTNAIVGLETIICWHYIFSVHRKILQSNLFYLRLTNCNKCAAQLIRLFSQNNGGYSAACTEINCWSGYMLVDNIWFGVHWHIFTGGCPNSIKIMRVFRSEHCGLYNKIN